jgi:chromosomal replication initiation ATPase DnaA
MTTGRQLAFDLPHREALGREDFLVSDSNNAAVAAIDAWPDWPHAGLVLIGPEGSGKTHLVEVWRQMSGARRLVAGGVSGDPQVLIADASAVIVEDCGPGLDETAMFHLLNRVEQAGADILLTARTEPRSWRIGLSDLVSRLSRIPVVKLERPDDLLLQAVMMKLFADRQVTVEASVLRYLAMRVERSFAAVRDMVVRLDRAAIEAKRPVSRSLAARILSETGEKPD